MKKTIATTLLLILAAAPFLEAEGPMVKGRKHRKLDFLVGDWSLESKHFRGDQEIPSEGAARWKWTLGDSWLVQSMEQITPVGKFLGETRITYDANRRSYVWSFTCNFNAEVLQMQGNWIDEDTLEFRSGEQLYAGKYKLSQILTFKRVSKDEFRAEMQEAWEGGEMKPAFVTVYRRAKKDGAS